MLRRPFSIQRIEDDVFDVLYRVVGVGTACMASMKAGREVEVLGPLGNAFSAPQAGERAVLLGGGVGIPPMVALADQLEASGAELLHLLSADGAAQLARMRAHLGSQVPADAARTQCERLRRLAGLA